MGHRDRHVRRLARLGQCRSRPWAKGVGLLCLLLPLPGGILSAQDGGLNPPSFIAFSNLLEEPGLIRYNRVEAISVGTRATFGSHGWLGDLTVRLGSADRKPNASVVLRRRSTFGELFVEAALGLRGTQPFDAPLGFENSVGAVVTGRDLGEYLREQGGRVGLRAFDGSWSVAVRAVSEQPVTVEPQRVWSLFRHEGLNQPAGTGIERPLANVNQTRRLLIEGILTQVWGRDPHRPSLRFGANGFANANYGGVVVRSALKLPMRTGERRQARPMFSLHIQNEVGAVSARAPAQDWRTVGGSWSVRGWEPGSLRGSRWVIGRAQANVDLVFTTVGAFFDAAVVGQAGQPFAPTRTRGSSIGVELAFLDGAIRVELATRLGQPDGVQVEGGLARPW